MKKSSFITLVLGIISSLFLGIGMCMAMLPEWNAFTPGVVIGCIGIILALCTVGVWRKMENKAPIKISGKLIGIILLGILSSLTLGVGMCLVMVWSNIMVGILVGLVGVLMLLCLIPLCIGIK
ncbi:MAG: hypothetical protein ACK5H4_06450 [Lacrimispora sphenoides]|jgi:hypothetical protein